MNGIKQMLNQARITQKKHEKFKKEVFKFSKQNNLIKIELSGSYKITLNIDVKNLLEELENDYEMFNDVIQVAMNEAISEVKKMESKIISTI